MTSSKNSFSISHVQVEQTAPGTFKITWKNHGTGGRVTICMGPGPEDIDRCSPLASVHELDCLTLTGLPPDRRPYFEVLVDEGPGIVSAPRLIPLEGAYNFRDLGGWETIDGRRIRWGQVYRSDGLARLTDGDLEYLRQLRLRLILDLRSQAEFEATPDRLPPGGAVEHLHLPIQSGELNFLAAMEKLRKGDASWLTEDFMVKAYLKNIDSFADVWAKVLCRLADPENRPMVFHCTGGKDRAGTAAALVLLALGVPPETVIHDHQLSNIYLARLMPKVDARISALGLDPEVVRPYFTAPLAGITAIIDYIHKNFGDPEEYLTAKAKLDPDILTRLRQQLLE